MSDDMIPAVEGEPKPDGYIGVVDQLGKRWWMSREVLTRRPPSTPLSNQQVDRIRAFKDILAEHDRTTLEQAVENFRRDAHPEGEIRLWERIAVVYRDELSERPSANAAERALIFRTLFACSFGATDVGSATAIDPQVAGLTNADRVIGRFLQAVPP